MLAETTLGTGIAYEFGMFVLVVRKNANTSLVASPFKAKTGNILLRLSC